MAGWHGGKGSGRRREDSKKLGDNWDAIFGKKDTINSTLENDNGVLEDGSSNSQKEETEEAET